MPRVSVIIATHDRPNLLARAIESAFAAAADVEVVVVDDGSPASTAEVCRAFPSLLYRRFDTKLGIAVARNAGIAASTADYITFLDDDDIRLPDSLTLQTGLLARDPGAALIYGRAIVDGGPQATANYPAHCPQGDVFWRLLHNNFMPCGSVVFRRSSIERAGMLDPRISGADDWDLWIRLAAVEHALAVEQPVLIWRQPTPTSGQGTSRPDRLIRMTARQFDRNWLRLPRAASAPAAVRQRARRQFADQAACYLAVEAASRLRAGLWGQACRHALTGLLLFPGAVARRSVSARSLLRLWADVAAPLDSARMTRARPSVARS
jgi:hypothetical protein